MQKLGMPLQPELDLLVSLDCNRLGLHWFSSEKLDTASAPGAGAALGMNWRCRAVDADAIKIQLYLLELEGACMGEKKWLFGEGKTTCLPRAPLAALTAGGQTHGATRALPPGFREPRGAGSEGHPKEGGTRQAGSIQGRGSLPAGPHWEAQPNSPTAPAALPSAAGALPRAG